MNYARKVLLETLRGVEAWDKIAHILANQKKQTRTWQKILENHETRKKELRNALKKIK